MRVPKLRLGRPRADWQPRATRLRRTLAALVAAAVLVMTALAWGGSDRGKPTDASSRQAAADRPPAALRLKVERGLRPAAPDVYAHTRAGMLGPAAKDDLERIYVPNSDADTVSVIDPRKAKVVDSFAVGDLPHHITPSHDLNTFYVDNTGGNSLT